MVHYIIFDKNHMILWISKWKDSKKNEELGLTSNLKKIEMRLFEYKTIAINQEMNQVNLCDRKSAQDCTPAVFRKSIGNVFTHAT